jgi:hypothetical protein
VLGCRLPANVLQVLSVGIPKQAGQPSCRHVHDQESSIVANKPVSGNDQEDGARHVEENMKIKKMMKRI